ncbi:hypothetical protein FOG48_04108 [Hanseniaspora uvarum]|nr:hypothetical protein FOG48_04108 [Hanseniaspora uvarum]
MSTEKLIHNSSDEEDNVISNKETKKDIESFNKLMDKLTDDKDSNPLLPTKTTVEASNEKVDEVAQSGYTLESILFPLILTILSFVVRMYKIGIADRVVWDEAHFGKFGSYYLRHEFYHDVHPPLGKMLVGLSGYLAGYSGYWDFPSGEKYPEDLDYVKMRLFQATFSALCTPIAYYTGKAIGLSIPSTWLLTILVCFENSYATLGRFILLDSMLLFFTVASFLCFVKFHNQRNQPFSAKWWKWIFLTGLTLGCTISVKMVGLFIITLVGIYTVIDLWTLFGDKSVKWSTYIFHWVARILALIVVPFSVFLVSFKIHFDLLSGTGPGDANMPSLFQASLTNSTVGVGPRDIAIGSSVITIKNQALGGTLLHSHVQTYPDGSKQQQVTGYGHKDSNNDWVLQRKRGDDAWNSTVDGIEYIVEGEEYRLVHVLTGRNLHTHPIPAPVTSSYFEVSGYGDDIVGDPKDNWVLEFASQAGDEDEDKLHLLTTAFRIKNPEMNCYLGQTGKILPQWGFRQLEMACIKDPFLRDKRIWWNIETHENELLPTAENFTYPKPNFFKSFVHLNLAMMATNNALIPDPEKDDQLASSFWEWPTLHVGIRMCGWDDDKAKYFMLGSPASTWLSTIGVFGFMILFVVYIIRWIRQFVDFADEKKFNSFLMGGFYPILGWGLHYMPFVIMGRVTYVHHYVPALYFALIILAYWFDWFTANMIKSSKGKLLSNLIYLTYYVVVIGGFLYFAPISFGMEKPSSEYQYLNWLSTWKIA